MKYIHELPAIREGLEQLVKKDPVFRKMDIDVEAMSWPYMRPGIGGLVRIIIGQQVSTKAAATMWQRFEAYMKKSVTPEKILKMSEEEFRALGISRQKATYIYGVAQAVTAKEFNIKTLEKLDDAGVAATITALKGMGPWSAHMYLMFSLGRPDIWPSGDLGIQEGMRKYLKLAERPKATDVHGHGDRFAPHRTAASLLLWRL